MKNLILLFWSCMFAVAPSVAFAATPDASIVDTVNKAMALAASTSILPQALTWLGSFMALQFVITNFGLLKSGSDIEAVFGKFIGSLAWFSFCIYLLNNGPDFIDTVGHAMLNKFAPNIPTPGSIIAATTALCSSILFAIVVTGTSIVGTGNSAVANVLIIVCITTFSIGLYMAIKIMMLSLELGLIVMLAPLSFSFLGLNALKDQGIAPFKSLISLTYRIILLGVLCTALGEVMKVSGDQLIAIDWTKPAQWGPGLNILISSIVAFPVIGYLIYKSDSIASSLASGSTDMGPGDVAKAAAAGAAAGAAVATGGSSLAGLATKVPQGMGDVLKQMMGGGASISNASNRGFGGQTPSGDAPQRAPSMSAGNSTGPSAPQRSTSASASVDSGVGGGRASTPGNAVAGAGQNTSAGHPDTAPRRSTSNSDDGLSSASAPRANAAEDSAQIGSSQQSSSSAQSSGNDDQAPARSAMSNGRTPPSKQLQTTPASAKQIEPAPVRPTQPDNLSAPLRSTSGNVSRESAPRRAASMSAGNSTGGSLTPRSTTSADSGMSGGLAVSAPGNAVAGSGQGTSTANADTAPSRSTSNSGDSSPAANVPATNIAGPSAHSSSAAPSTSRDDQAPVRSAGSNVNSTLSDGSAAGITGAPGTTSDTQNQKPKPALGEKLSQFNEHLAQEKAATHISINTHHQD